RVGFAVDLAEGRRHHCRSHRARLARAAHGADGEARDQRGEGEEALHRAPPSALRPVGHTASSQAKLEPWVSTSSVASRAPCAQNETAVPSLSLAPCGSSPGACARTDSDKFRTSPRNGTSSAL